MLRLLVVAPFLLLCAAVGTAQRQVWIVDRAGGPGVHFTDIQPAIDAASPGDRVQVVARSNVIYAGFALGKGLDLEGIGMPVVAHSAIDGVPVSQWVRVSGVNFSAPELVPPRLLVSRCPGPVLVANVRALSFYGTAVYLRDCAQALLLDSVMWGGGSEGGGTPGLVAERCGVQLQRCTLTGALGSGAGIGGGDGNSGGAGLWAVASTVSAAQCTLTGGDGGAGRCFPCICRGGFGGPGVSTDGPLLLMAGCTAVSGRNGVGSCVPIPNGPAVVAFGPPARMTSDCTGTTQNVTSIPPLPWVQSPGSVNRGATANLVFTATPGTLVMLYFDLRHGFLWLPGIDGPFLLTVQPLALPLLGIGGSGVASLNLPVPQDPGLADQFVFVQGIALQLGHLMPSLTNAGDLRIR